MKVARPDARHRMNAGSASACRWRASNRMRSAADPEVSDCYRDHPILQRTAEQLREYFAATADFDLPLQHRRGSAFHSPLAALRKFPRENVPTRHGAPSRSPGAVRAIGGHGRNRSRSSSPPRVIADVSLWATAAAAVAAGSRSRAHRAGAVSPEAEPEARKPGAGNRIRKPKPKA